MLENSSQYNKSDYLSYNQQLILDTNLQGMFPHPLDEIKKVRMLALYDFSEFDSDFPDQNMDKQLMMLFNFLDRYNNLWEAYLSIISDNLGAGYLIAKTDMDSDRLMRHGEISVSDLYMQSSNVKLAYVDMNHNNGFIDCSNEKQKSTLIKNTKEKIPNVPTFPLFFYNPMDTLPINTTKGEMQLHNLVPTGLSLAEDYYD